MPLSGHCVAKAGQKVYVIGGWLPTDVAQSAVYIYDFTDLSAPTYELGPPLAETRADGGCTTLDSNAIVVLGGKKSGWTFKTVEILVEGSNAWKFGKQSFFSVKLLVEMVKIYFIYVFESILLNLLRVSE